jgi:hypothetical protein
MDGESDFTELPVPFAHSERLYRLPITRIRSIGCSSRGRRSRGTLVTDDRRMAPYDVRHLWV